jgi:predicted RNase H-like HicB family nuclease
MKLPTISFPDEDGYYVASVPELAGCYTQGKTLEEVRKRIREAIDLYLAVHPGLKKEKTASFANPCWFVI